MPAIFCIWRRRNLLSARLQNTGKVSFGENWEGKACEGSNGNPRDTAILSGVSVCAVCAHCRDADRTLRGALLGVTLVLKRFSYIGRWPVPRGIWCTCGGDSF